MVNAAVTSKKEGPGFESRLVPFCVVFACSPHVCELSLATLNSSPISKICMGFRLVDHSKLTLCANVKMNGICLYALALPWTDDLLTL